MPIDVNPYAPTAHAAETTEKQTSGSFAIAMTSGLAALAFSVFTVMLLRSTASDFEAGMMFVLNIPPFIGLVVTATRSKRLAAYVAIVAACVQIAITLNMLRLGIGDTWIVVLLNLIIVLVLVVIAAWSWLSNRRKLAIHG